MFTRGPRDEGLQRLSRKLPVHASCDEGGSFGAYQSDHGCDPLHGPRHHKAIAEAYHDRLVEVNNIACSLYENGMLDDSLAKLLMFVETVQRAVPCSIDDVSQQSLAIILRNMAHIYFVKEKHAEALYFSREAIDSNTRDDDAFSASLWFNVGFLIWQVEKSSEEAECALSQSLHILTRLRTECIPPAPTQVDRDIVSVQALLLLIREQREGHARENAVSLLRMLMAKRASFGYEHESVSSTLCALGNLYMKQRNFASAMCFLFEALRLQQHLNLSETDKLRTLTQLGQCLQPLGRDVEAMSCFREALRLKGKTILSEGPQIQAVFATALYNIGMIQSCQGDRNDQQRRMRALHSFKLCLDLRRKALGPENPAVASALHNIGILLLEDGRVAKSMECFQESLQIRRKAYGSLHHEVASSLRHIGKINHDRGEWHESLRLHLEALWILRQSSRDSSEHLVEVLMGLGQAQHSNGLMDQALKSYEEASKLLRRRRDRGHRNATQHMVRVLNIMGGLALDMVDTDSANNFYAEAAKLSGQKHTIVNHVPPCAAAA